MRHLHIKNRRHKTLQQEFKTWLETLSYNTFTVEYSPIYIQEFLHWLEARHTTIKKVNETTIIHYFDYLSRRPNQLQGGGLSNDYLNSHLRSLKQFSNYLQQSAHQGFAIRKDYYPSTHRENILTRKQITALYEACDTDTSIGLRDRAILALYYGCGLRRHEGIHVNIEDVLLNNKLLHVRKGKQYRERYVPLAKQVQEDIDNYLTIGRPLFPHYEQTPALLLNRYGKRTSGKLVLERVKLLGAKANISEVDLHTLRHSIATHLLHAGMSLEQVSRFLGHASLESTQRYTHLAEQLI